MNETNQAIAEDIAENPDCPRCGQSYYVDCYCYECSNGIKINLSVATEESDL